MVGRNNKYIRVKQRTDSPIIFLGFIFGPTSTNIVLLTFES